MDIIKTGPPVAMIPKLIEIANTHGFVFVWQEKNGDFKAMTNLKPPTQIVQFLRDVMDGQNQVN